MDPAPDRPAAAAAEPRRRFSWLRAADDRMPTKWFAAIGTAVFLAVTAAFGGLAPVAADGPTPLAPGTEHVNAQLALTVTGAVLVDVFPGVQAGADERILALRVDARNAWTEPLATTPGQSVADAIVLTSVPEARPLGVVRRDDLTLSPTLQPDVPAPLALAWAVPAGALAAGDRITVHLRDETLTHGSMIVTGSFWSDPVTAATMTLPVADGGPGSRTATP